jgi:hypothetical protein
MEAAMANTSTAPEQTETAASTKLRKPWAA